MSALSLKPYGLYSVRGSLSYRALRVKHIVAAGIFTTVGLKH